MLKAPPVPVLMGIKGLKPKLPSCRREYGSISCEFTLGKSQMSSAGALTQLSEDKLSHFLASVSQGQSVFP